MALLRQTATIQVRVRMYTFGGMVQRHPSSHNSLLAAALLLLATPHLALAYVDPGTGAMLWQILAAGVLGAAFYFRKVLTRIRSIWAEIEPSESEASAAPVPNVSSGD